MNSSNFSKHWIISLLAILAALIAYFSGMQNQPKFQIEKHPLQLDMTTVVMFSVNRQEASEEVFQIQSHEANYHDETQETNLTIVNIKGKSKEQMIEGQAKILKAKENTFELNQSVQFKTSAPNEPNTELNTEQLLIDTQNHTLFSPNAITMTQGKGQISAQSMTGNYQQNEFIFNKATSQWQ